MSQTTVGVTVLAKNEEWCAAQFGDDVVVVMNTYLGTIWPTRKLRLNFAAGCSGD